MTLLFVLGILAPITRLSLTNILHSGPEDTLKSSGKLANYDINKWNSRDRVQVQNFADAAPSNNRADVDTAVANVSVSGAFHNVEQLPDVESVHTVPKSATVEPDDTWTDGTQLSMSALEEYCAETVEPPASNADVDNAKGESAHNSRLPSW